MNRKHLMLAFVVPVIAGACGQKDTSSHETVATPAGEFVDIAAREVPAVLEANGVAEPFAEAALGTKLMGTILAVHVREGDPVRTGAVLLELDARDLDAKAAQIDASLQAAKAVLNEAALHAARLRMLFAEDAAPKAQLDAAETALERAQAGVAAANAARAELEATRDYAVVRAPFDGTVVRRMVDPGAFATPGAPLLVVQDARWLRLAVTVPPDVARTLERGQMVAASVEGASARAAIEGIVPSVASLYTVNALLDNSGGIHLAGSAATLKLPIGVRDAFFVPRVAVSRQGDLTGLVVWDPAGPSMRWVRLGDVEGDSVEVVSGLRTGDRVLIPAALAGAN